MRYRSKQVLVRLTVKEHNHLKRQAEKSGLKMEQLIRGLIMGLEIKPKPPEVYAGLLRELSAIGNNVNQIAHVANSTKEIDKGEVEELTKLINTTWRLVKETL